MPKALLERAKTLEPLFPNKSTRLFGGESSGILNWNDIAYPHWYKMYKRLVGNFWQADEINMSSDVKQFPELTKAEQDAYLKIIGLLATLDGAAAEALVKNKVKAVAEGANMPSTPEAVEIFLENKVLFGPAKAANAGGVAVSSLEMAQNSMRMSWTFDEVDSKLQEIMKNIYQSCIQSAEEFDLSDNLGAASNIAGFRKVADAMIAHGVV